jgi:hypothetical protein
MNRVGAHPQAAFPFGCPEFFPNALSSHKQTANQAAEPSNTKSSNTTLNSKISSGFAVAPDAIFRQKSRF